MISKLLDIRIFPMLTAKIGRPKWILLFYVLVFSMEHVFADEYKFNNFYGALVNITYRDPKTGEMRSEKKEIGMYGKSSRLDTEWGWVVHVRTEDNKTHGCTPPVNIPKERWIALVERGSCKFKKKVQNAAIVKNASAVVVYNHKDDHLLKMEHNVGNEPDIMQTHHITYSQVDDVVSIFISKSDGEHIAELVDNGTRVMMHISVGTQQSSHYSSINKTSVLFVSISFIVLMIISLAWLVFYYIQRFRYAHAKERLSKRLMNAAKKAITKMPLRTIKSGDQETESDFDQCAVCIESYRASDIIRILPCKHMFHKSCVDPWLIEQRSCPMCKLDILKAYGLQIHGSRDSVVNIDLEGPSTSLGPSELMPTDVLRDLESDVLEVIRYQPTHVEYHAPCCVSRTDTTDSPALDSSGSHATSDNTGRKRSVSDNRGNNSDNVVLEEIGNNGMEESKLGALKPAISMESVHSVDSESNELQSLMTPDENVDSPSLRDQHIT